MSREKKSVKKASVERRVQTSSRVVKMNQPWRQIERTPYGGLGKMTDHQVKTKFVREDAGTRSFKSVLDGKTARCEDDGEGEPEATVGRERSGTESISHGHLPAQRRLAIFGENTGF